MASGHRSTTSATTRFMLLPFMLILQLSLSAHAESCSNFPAIFNFGDSNSDTGGMSALLMPLSLPFGQTFFGMPVGRYSDGRLTIDFMGMAVEHVSQKHSLDDILGDISIGYTALQSKEMFDTLLVS